MRYTNCMDNATTTQPATETMQFDFFWRRESNHHHPKSVPAVSMTMQLPVDIDIQDAIAAARENGMSKGTHRTGCFEVQTDRGIYAHVDENRMDWSTPRKAAKVVYKTWEQITEEEEAEDAAAAAAKAAAPCIRLDFAKVEW